MLAISHVNYDSTNFACFHAHVHDTNPFFLFDFSRLHISLFRNDNKATQITLIFLVTPRQNAGHKNCTQVSASAWLQHACLHRVAIKCTPACVCARVMHAKSLYQRPAHVCPCVQSASNHIFVCVCARAHEYVLTAQAELIPPWICRQRLRFLL